MSLSEIILGIVTITLVIERYVYSREMNSQIRELSKLVKAKDTIEYATSQHIQTSEPVEKETPEFVDASSLSDGDFFKLISKQVENGGQE